MFCGIYSQQYPLMLCDALRTGAAAVTATAGD